MNYLVENKEKKNISFFPIFWISFFFVQTFKRNSGFITCLVCNQTKYYSHVQRRYGIFRLVDFFSRFFLKIFNLIFFISSTSIDRIGTHTHTAVSHVLNFSLVSSKNLNIFNVMIKVRQLISVQNTSIMKTEIFYKSRRMFNRIGQ